MAEDFMFRKDDAEGGWIRAFDYGWHGAAAVVQGLREVLEHKGTHTVTFVVLDHPNQGNKCYGGETIGLASFDGELTFRFCGSGGPESGGSHGLGPASDLAECAVTLAIELMHKGKGESASIYRQPSKRVIGWEIDGTINR